MNIPKKDLSIAIPALDRLHGVVQKRYPDASPEQVEAFDAKVIDIISENFEMGFDLALIKREKDRTRLKIVKFFEEDAK